MGLRPLPLLSHYTTFIRFVTMKIYRVVLVVLFVLFLVEGFRGEFYSPTVFDFIKWIAWLLAAVLYILCKRRNQSCD